VSFFKPKFVLLALAGSLLPALWTSGCTGDAFTSDATAVGGSTSSGGSSSSAGKGNGTGAGTGVKCGGPEDCDDNESCTADLCNADGTCDTSPKCAGTEKCCDGDCNECCDNADCDDGVSCTTNTCFSGQCMYVPDDTKCDMTQYCSVKDGCRGRAACGILAGEDPATACDDDSSCTTDSCENNLCQHEFCAEGKLCCEGTTLGCADQCCTDSQCDKDNDPCTVGSCNSGKCSLTPLCGDGQECCPSADGKTATCGSCCSATKCDDKVACTTDQCGGGQCSNTPDPRNCPVGYLCDAVKGCQKAPVCNVNGDCKPASCQTNPKCDMGACRFDGCAGGTHCCSGAGTAAGCKICCDDSGCTDNIACTQDMCGPNGCSHTPVDTLCQQGQLCDARLGCVGCVKDTDCDDQLDCTTDICNQQTNTCSNISSCGKFQYCTGYGCSTCVSDSDCQGAVLNVILPPGNCSVSTCVKGQCQTVTNSCGDFQICCPPYGCQLNCGIETQ
jgi:hypothetical protein